MSPSEQPTDNNWDEEFYLSVNGDVKAAIAEGIVSTGFEHFIKFGRFENRSHRWLSKGDTKSLFSLWPWSTREYLRHNPELSEEELRLQHKQSPFEHYRKFGLEENRKKGNEEELERIRHLTRSEKWLAEEMAHLSYYEPLLDSAHFGQVMHYEPATNLSWTTKYYEQTKYLLNNEYEYVFLLPWLKHGGADLAALLHIQAAAERGARVLVVTTEPTTSEWAHRCPEGVDVLPFGEHYREISPELHVKLLYALLVGVNAKVVHVINSHVGWRLIEDHGAAIRQLFQLYVSLYCYDYLGTGEPVGYARRMTGCGSIPHRIFTDNTDFKGHLIEHYGIDPGQIEVLKHPVANTNLYPKKINFASNKILWASRLDRQKQPELLAKIAKELPQFEFHVYGSFVTSDPAWTHKIHTALAEVPNIKMKGGFQTFSELLRESYLLFLYTSAWDGLPNIILEAIAAGFLVIAPSIGGLKSDLGAERLVLVDDPSDINGYLDAVKWVCSNDEMAEKIRANSFEYVRTNHTWESFSEKLDKAGYFLSEGKPDLQQKVPSTKRKVSLASAK